MKESWIRRGPGRVALLAVAATTMGCPSPAYYVATNHVTYQVNKERSADEDVRMVEGDAPALLRPGATIAFFPPSDCAEGKKGEALATASASGSREDEALIRMKCGVLMSGLEKAAALDGYRVVSWQLLGQTDALQRARELRVDVLFEVDQLTVEARDTGYKRRSEITFAKLEDGEREPVHLEDAEAVGARCNRTFAKRMQSETLESSTLAVKMVGVQDGRAKWFFRRSFSEAPKAEEKDDRFYEAKPGGTSWIGWTLLGVGTFVGGALVISGADSNFDKRGPIVAGLLFIGGGVAAVSFINGSPPPADKVLCRGSAFTTDPTARKKAVKKEVDEDVDEAPEDGSGTKASFQEQRAGERDAKRDRHEKLVKGVVSEFTREMKKLAASTPAAPLPPPAPPPPAATAPPPAAPPPPPPATAAAPQSSAAPPPAPTAPPPKGCATNKDCKAGRVCRAGACVSP